MKILVTVKEVAEVEEDFELDGLRVADQYLDYDLNEWDEYAVEEAVQIAEESDDDVEVVAVTIGPSETDETIRQALATGPTVRSGWDDHSPTPACWTPRRRPKYWPPSLPRKTPTGC